MSSATLTRPAPQAEIAITPRVRGYSVRRYYDPQSGQFISVDPAVDQTETPYAYVDGDPVDAVDPLGLGCGSWLDPHPLGCAKDVASAWSAGAGDIYSGATHFVSNNEFGLCASATGGFIVGGVASGCVVVNAHGVGVTGTAGFGAEVPGGVSVGVGPLFALGARSPADLGRGFTYAGGAVGDVVPVAGGDVAVGEGTCHQPVAVFTLWAGLGLNLPWLWSVHAGRSYTWTAGMSF
jgi:hypothetical protein